MEVTSGFLVVKTFERMYRDYLIKFEKYKRISPELTYDPIPLEQMPGKYRGVARNPIVPWLEEFRGSGMIEEPTEQELKPHLGGKCKLYIIDSTGGYYECFAFFPSGDIFNLAIIRRDRHWTIAGFHNLPNWDRLWEDTLNRYAITLDSGNPK